MAKQTDLQKAYEAALLKGLTSDTAAERVAAIKAVSDRENPALGELTTKLKQAEDRLDEAKSSLKEITTERDTLAAKVVELQPLADKAGELDTLRAENETWKADARKELVSMAQQERFKAEATLRAAEEKLHEADNKVSASGWTELRKTLADLLAQHSLPMPDFWSTSSDTMPSAFWTLWGWSPAKAKIFTAYKASYKSATESFKAQAYKILTSSGLPSFPIFQRQSEDGSQQLEYAPQVEIPDLGVHRECLLEMAQRFGCAREIQQRVEQKQLEIMGRHLQQNAVVLEAQQISLSQQGYGRQAQDRPAQAPITGFTGDCPALCVCERCNPGRRLATSIDPIEETF
jgi:hypothetical protein